MMFKEEALWATPVAAMPHVRSGSASLALLQPAVRFAEARVRAAPTRPARVAPPSAKRAAQSKCRELLLRLGLVDGHNIMYAGHFDFSVR